MLSEGPGAGTQRPISLQGEVVAQSIFHRVWVLNISPPRNC